jgi:ribulose-5-phosphate 4-epimerase/fuculose-1-phosphate aldolase
MTLTELVDTARRLGGQRDIAQGSGGNLSVKLGPNEMRIKASGYAFSELDGGTGIATADPQAFLELYGRCAAAPAPDDPVKAGQLITACGMPRPSMEAAFHAFLDTAVIHTHPIWTNAIACAEDGERIAREVYGTDVTWIPYRTPGHELAMELYQRTRTGKPAAIMLQNHGVITAGPSLPIALSIHDRIVDAAKRYLESKSGPLPSWPSTQWEQHGGLWLARNPALAYYASDPDTALDLLTVHPFPDSFVFTQDLRTADSVQEAQAGAGRVIAVCREGMAYRATHQRAQEFNDILTASALVRELAGRIDHPRYLPQDKLDELAQLEAEKYRQDVKR